jgi:SAM-dependent methyltransferase
MWLYLKNKSDFFTKKDLKVMHIAPEQCFHSLFKKQKNLDYTTGDLMSPIADLHFDLHDIPLEDNTYEVVFCNHVMEHVKDDLQCMKELHRIMKPGGWGIMQVPIDANRTETYEDWSITDPKEREKHFWQYDHVRLYGLNYAKRLEEAGFKVDVIDFSKELPTETFERYRIPKSELLYVVRKA